VFGFVAPDHARLRSGPKGKTQIMLDNVTALPSAASSVVDASKLAHTLGRIQNLPHVGEIRLTQTAPWMPRAWTCRAWHSEDALWHVERGATAHEAAERLVRALLGQPIAFVAGQRYPVRYWDL
jgi:hypothetical protein